MRQVLFEIPLIHLRIFGFGLMLCLAFLAAIGLAAWRARRKGFDPEWIYDLAFGVMVGGVVGARAFYAWQYWGTDRMRGWSEVLRIWEGGLVFYGGLIGAAVGGLIVAWRRRMPILAMLDVVAPPVALGLALGRIGCFLNGCCYGDPCDLPIAVRFPPGSPPWWHQALDANRVPTDRLIPGISRGLLEQVRQGNVPPGTSWSAPVHPTQLYSAFDGIVLLILLTTYDRVKRRDGQVMALLLIVYPITRALIEYLRGDEAAFFAGLTISQNVSVVVFVLGLAMWLALQATALRRSSTPARVVAPA
jgi:phosphatidylglycerol:prolipoprotein diacylglycerol transferase